MTARGHGSRVETPLTVLYRDAHLAVVDKPSGVAVHKGWARDARPVLQRLRDQLGTFVYPVHRLDRATSGALVFALSTDVARGLALQFEARAVDKLYIALCRGRDPSLSLVDYSLAKKTENGTTTERQPAVTAFRYLGHYERYGLYEARPRTGRAHQIRRHLKHASHPIIGDVRYGKGEHNRLFRTRFGFHRLALHALELAFEHPMTGRAVHVRAPVSADLRALFEAIGLQATADAAGRARRDEHGDSPMTIRR